MIASQCISCCLIILTQRTRVNILISSDFIILFISGPPNTHHVTITSEPQCENRKIDCSDFCDCLDGKTPSDLR